MQIQIMCMCVYRLIIIFYSSDRNIECNETCHLQCKYCVYFPEIQINQWQWTCKWQWYEWWCFRIYDEWWCKDNNKWTRFSGMYNINNLIIINYYNVRPTLQQRSSRRNLKRKRTPFLTLSSVFNVNCKYTYSVYMCFMCYGSGNRI